MHRDELASIARKARTLLHVAKHLTCFEDDGSAHVTVDFGRDTASARAFYDIFTQWRHANAKREGQ